VSLSTAAIVVSHNRPDLLAACLQGLAEQTRKPDQIIVVDTAGNQECAQLALDANAALIQPGPVKLGAAIEAGRLALSEQPGWLWLMHDDAVAESWALERLLKTAEVSPSVAIVGGKLLEASRPGVIQQLGLTVTAVGTPFLLVQDEFDQGQHDSVSDTLAVSTAGMLISNRAWQKLGGLRDDVPLFAADVDLGARARVAGYRVIVEPAARFSHHGLSMTGGRTRSWLGAARWFALRRAQLHLGFTITRLPIALVLALLSPLTGVARAVGQIAQKRPQRFFGELVAPLEFLLTLPRAIAARQRITSLGSRVALSGLFATLKQQRARRQARLRHLPAGAPGEASRGLVATGSWWLGLFAVALNIEMFPRAAAIISSPLAPLGESLPRVFGQTASTGVSAVGGAGVPSDPFNWALLAMAAFSPTEPSLALAIFMFVAPALAFWGAWQLISLVARQIWLRNLLALGYALNPVLLQASRELHAPDLLAMAALPWVAYLAARVALAATPARAWRWLGLGGLAFSLLAVSSVPLAALMAVLVLVLAAVRWRRAAVLVWLPIAGVALLAPAAMFAFQTLPLLALRVSWLPENLPPEPQISWLFALPLVFFAGLALSAKGWLLALGFWVAALLAGAAAWLLPAGSVLPLVAAVWLALSLAAALAVQTLSRPAFGLLLAIALLPGPLLALTERPSVEWGEPRVAPALVAASAAAGENLRTLVITSPASGSQSDATAQPELAAQLLAAGAGTLESGSLFVEALKPNDELRPLAAELAARLASGNERGLSELLSATSVGFVLLAEANPDLETNLESLPQLVAAGETRWGKLYRVLNGVEYQVDQGANPIRLAQLAVLAGYLLLAVPTAAAIRGSYRRRK
jgi:GT2 family glycosyltransferase